MTGTRRAVRFRLLNSALFLGVTALGCNETTGLGAKCSERDGIRLCIDRTSYRPGWTIRLTIDNRGAQTVYQDLCSVDLTGTSGVLSSLQDVEPEYDPRRYCGQDVTLEVIVSQMRELPPGGTLTVNKDIPFTTFQGFFRIDVWFLDAEGTNLPGSPYSTQPFDIFRTAG